MILRYEFTGTGGQGVITAAIILAEAALYHAGLNAVQTQIYGPEARGGAARSDLILSDEEIFFPKVVEPNVLVCLSQSAYDKYYSEVRPGGVILSDPAYVQRMPNVSTRHFELPMSQTVINALDTARALNMCMLGALCSLIGVVSVDAVKQAILDHFGNKMSARLEENLSAVDLGGELVGEAVSVF